jgi:tetratricopeptide (TPR) repeat protein
MATAKSQLARLVVLATAIAVVLTTGLYVHRWLLLRKLPSPNLQGRDPEIAQAIDAARRDVEQSPRSPSAWGRLGMVLMIHDFGADALPCLRRAAQLDPAQGRWPYYQGLLLASQHAEAALRNLETAVRLCGDSPDAPRFKLAELLFGLDRLPEAEAQFQACLKINPDHPRALLGLSRIAFQRGELKTCKNYLVRAVANDPDLKSACLLLAQVKHREGDLAGAEKERRRAAEIRNEKHWPDPFQEEVNRLRTGEKATIIEAGKLWRQGRAKEALALIEPAAQRYPNSEWVWIQLGTVRHQLREFAASEEAFQKAVQLVPNSYWAHYRLGVAQTAQKKYSAAETSLRRALELKPDDAGPHCTLGICQARTQRWEEARQSFQNALRYKPDNVEAHVELGQVYIIFGDVKNAWSHVQLALRIQPKNVKGNRLLLRLLVGIRLGA